MSDSVDGSRAQSSQELAHPSDLSRAEQDMLTARRSAAGLPLVDQDHPRVGLALSGGGIRSATFSLGVLQGLARRTARRSHRSVLEHVDYLSTVSGGGYIGGFLGMLFQRTAQRERGVEPALEALRDIHSTELRWLRENGRYLSPNGSGDALIAGATMLRNWLTILFVLAVLSLVPFLGLRLSGASLTLLSASYRHPFSGFWTATVLLPLMSGTLCTMHGIAYWLLPDAPSVRALHPRLGVLVLSAVLGTGAFLGERLPTTPPGMFAWAGLLAIVLAGAWALCVVGQSRRPRGSADGASHDRALAARRWLSQGLMVWLWLTVGLFVLALCDALGRAFFVRSHELGWTTLASAFASFSAVAVGARKIASLLASTRTSSESQGGVRLPIPLDVLAFALAALVVVGLLSALSAMSHGIAATGAVLAEDRARARFWTLAVAMLVALASSFVFSRMRALVNYSSLATLYSARLTRAYLGASNPARQRPENQSVADVVHGDDVMWSAYEPHRHGGPLHVVNLTLNETVLGRSQIEQRDRKGLPFAIGPAGISVGVRHHARWDESRTKLEPIRPADEASLDEAVFIGRTDAPLHPERLSLGRWIALSGAAVSTGLGSRTSLGTSLLCGLLNLRLGHWWWSDTEPKRRRWWSARRDRASRWFSRVLPVQAHLLDELLARFPGTASRYWYLTDGGHFENTAVYELVRRRVPFIIAVDAGADATYQLGDAGELVRKCRLDFGAEIELVSPASLHGIVDDDALMHFREIDDASGERATPRKQAYATLATIRYAGESQPSGLLLMLKPCLMGSEDLDVLAYARTHAAFPQESTADQFFDEAQWESYRRLGDHIASCLFDDVGSTAAWSPASLDARALLDAVRGAATRRPAPATYIAQLKVEGSTAPAQDGPSPNPR